MRTKEEVYDSLLREVEELAQEMSEKDFAAPEQTLRLALWAVRRTRAKLRGGAPRGALARHVEGALHRAGGDHYNRQIQNLLAFANDPETDALWRLIQGIENMARSQARRRFGRMF